MTKKSFAKSSDNTMPCREKYSGVKEFLRLSRDHSSVFIAIYSRNKNLESRITLKEICHLTHLSKGRVNCSVKFLINEGLITRKSRSSYDLPKWVIKLPSYLKSFLNSTSKEIAVLEEQKFFLNEKLILARLKKTGLIFAQEMISNPSLRIRSKY